MAITAQQLDRRITVQRVTTVNNELNEPVGTWADLATIWARRVDVSDRQRLEFVAAGQVGSFAMARFTVRSFELTRSITAVDRLMHEGKIWEIKGVKEADEGRRRFLEITASRDAD